MAEAMSGYYFLFLFFVIVLVSLYDLKYQEIPNWISLPLIFIGLITGFPGNPTIWIGSIFIFQAWRLGIIGGGDAKLWVGLLWCLFSFVGERILLVMSISLMITGLAQILVRVLTKKKVETGIKVPGAWRTVVFMGCVAYLNSANWL
jgi:Flp pilus assembly protein protease CpaA